MVAEKYYAFQENEIFGLKSWNEQYCLLASFEGRLVIRTLGLDYNSEQETIEDIRPGDVSLLGTCAKDKIDKPYLELIWSAIKGKRFRLRLSFTADIAANLKKGTKEYKWKLSDVKLTYYPPTARTINETFVGTMLSRSQIFAPLTQSFYCKHSLNVTLADSNTENSEKTVDVTLQFKADIKIQPYNVESNGVFSNKYLCERSREIGLMERLHSNTTILAGCILGFVAVAILIGYSAKRYIFAEQHGYAYMD
uniref:Uncharacterized protein n=1 Tax=Romanomermis culicivorax TaxID=13658 RepID=A0A915K9X2_ROMCU